jgi:hypothetical protein
MKRAGWDSLLSWQLSHCIAIPLGRPAIDERPSALEPWNPNQLAHPPILPTLVMVSHRILYRAANRHHSSSITPNIHRKSSHRVRGGCHRAGDATEAAENGVLPTSESILNRLCFVRNAATAADPCM